MKMNKRMVFNYKHNSIKIVEQLPIKLRYKKIYSVISKMDAKTIGREAKKIEQRRTNILLEWMRKTKRIYPTKEERELLAEKSNMTAKSVNYWFSNWRRRKMD